MTLSRIAALAALSGIVAAAPSSKSHKSSAVNTTTCGGQTYVYQELAGYGFVPGNARDKFGDTLGGIGSSIAIDKNTWKKKGQSYSGILWALPDRGWNTQGTLNFQNRVHKFEITLSLNSSATVKSPSGPNLNLQYLDTILFTDPKNIPVTGLDPDADGPYLQYPGFPELPSTIYTGDGFGNNGTGGHRVSVDSEGLVLNSDGSFWVSDEYGPYIYKFSPSGKMLDAIRPPNATIPLLYEAEYVIPLPLYSDGSVAGQSEIHFLTPTQFFILARDSGAGHGQDSSESVYRHIDIFDISNATDIKTSSNDAFDGAIASAKGSLDKGIQAAAFCSFLDFNVNAQLNRFG
ncbi:outer membrane autotransporter, partial [Aureobasidium pullulans]